MSGTEGNLGRLLLRHYSSLKQLGRLPVVGPWFSWAAGRAVPRDSLVWTQVRTGPAAGIWLHLNPRTAAGTINGTGGRVELEVVNEHLREGMTFYDVGANVGIFSLMAARVVGSRGRVVSFEADPEIAERLQEHANRNGFSWVNVEQKAAWRESGKILFERVDPAVSPDRGVGHVVDSRTETAVSVDAVALDDCVEKYPAPDFIKCDVESAETEVFQGARKLLEKKRPGILIEIHTAANRSFLLGEFARLHYRCTDCDELHILALPQ